NAQQAPAAARQVCAFSALKVALSQPHSNNAGKPISASHSNNRLNTVFAGVENRLLCNHAKTPTLTLGGSGDGLNALSILALHQRHALVIPIHEHRDGQTYR